MRKWVYGIGNKMKIASALTLMVILILWNNLSDRKRIGQLESSFSSIYEDRLMVESFIFRLSEILHEREKLLITESYPNAILISHNAELKGLIKEYASTKFTEKEAIVFNEFVSKVKPLYASESLDEIASLSNTKTQTNEALFHLSELSKIQTSEGERLINEGKNIILSNKSASQFEVLALILLALFVQMLIFSSKSILEKIHHKPHLN